MFKGIGTVINVLAIIGGGLVGLAGGRFIKQNYQDMVLRATAIAIMFIGASGAFAKLIFINDDGIAGQRMHILGADGWSTAGNHDCACRCSGKIYE